MDSVNKKLKAAAHATFAIAVGYVDGDGNDPLLGPGNTPVVHEGTAIAINSHHLLSCAPVFDLDLSRYPHQQPQALRYKYFS